MSGNLIKTSVIIPIYNTEKYLKECIESVLNQTQKEIEIILVDDGSTDGCKELIKQYESKYPNIIAICQENQKQGAARNAGLERATGKYIYFLDSDDYIAPNLLESCYGYAEEKEADFVSFDAHSFCEVSNYNGTIFQYDRSKTGISDEIMSGTEYWRKFFLQGGVYVCAYLMYIRRDFLQKNEIKFMPKIYYEDNEWCLDAYLRATKVYYIPQKYYYRRYRDNSTVTSVYSHEHLKSVLVIYQQLLDKYKNQIDSAKKQMVEDMLYSISSLLATVVKDIFSRDNNEKYLDQIHLFINDLLERKEEKTAYSEKLYIRMLMLIKFICKCGCVDYGNGLLDDEITHFIMLNYKLQENIRIAIYGMGKMCDEILEWYAAHGIEIKADIVFLASGSTAKEYRTYPVYDVNHIDAENFEHIIIASRKYSQDMLENLKIHNIKSNGLFVTLGKLNW